MNTLRLRISGWVLFFLLMTTVWQTAWADTPEPVVDQKTDVRYTVRPGDTLWSISARFFDTPEVWPDLWSQNPHLTNPHRLRPGDTVYIIREAHQEKIVAEPETFNEPSGGKPLAPAQRIRKYRYPGIDRVGFLDSLPVPASAEIISVRGNSDLQKEMISQGDRVYIRSKTGSPLPVDSRYTIFRILDPVRHPLDNRTSGYPHYLTGQVTILESEGDLSLGKIDHSYRPIQVHDLLMPYDPPVESIPLLPATPSISGTLLGTEEKDGIFGHGALVFIDKGTVDGVRPGQIYSLFTTERTGNTELVSDYGEILVVRARETASTALVTRADRPVLNAAGFHSPLTREMVRKDLP